MPRYSPVDVTSPAAVSLLTDYFGEREETFPTGRGSYRTAFPVAATFTPPAGVFLVVNADGAHGDAPSVACGGVRRIEPTREGLVRYEVKHLFVRPSGRGAGLGRLLMAELERRAVDLGADLVVLDTNESLLAAGALYRSSGYDEVEPYNDNPNATTWFAKRVGDG